MRERETVCVCASVISMSIYPNQERKLPPVVLTYDFFFIIIIGYVEAFTFCFLLMRLNLF